MERWRAELKPSHSFVFTTRNGALMTVLNLNLNLTLYATLGSVADLRSASAAGGFSGAVARGAEAVALVRVHHAQRRANDRAGRAQAVRQRLLPPGAPLQACSRMRSPLEPISQVESHAIFLKTYDCLDAFLP